MADLIGPKVTNITVYLPVEAKRKIKEFATSQGTTISWLVRNFLDNLIKDIDKKEKN